MKAKDLAKKLGVSPATISLVLNNKPGISDSLRKTLLEKIQELGHEEMLSQSCREGGAPGAKPSPAPREERCACKSIAYLMYNHFQEDMNDPYQFFTQVLEGIEYEAWENDCCIVMLHMNRREGLDIAQRLRRAGNVVGAIVHPCKLDARVERDVKAAGVPCVFMDAFAPMPSGWEPPSVCISNRQGMHSAVGHLVEKGHQEVGYVFSGWETPVEVDRRKWFRRALKNLGLADRPEYYFQAGTGEELFEYQRLADRLAGAQRLPSALVCENDRQAWRAIKALKQLGLGVPEDVSVIGFDDQALCTAIEPNITSIHNSPHLMGRECVMLLQNLIRLREREEEPWLRYELPARLVQRDSVRDLG